jgi:hypothetical protein
MELIDKFRVAEVPVDTGKKQRENSNTLRQSRPQEPAREETDA